MSDKECKEDALEFSDDLPLEFVTPFETDESIQADAKTSLDLAIACLEMGLIAEAIISAKFAADELIEWEYKSDAMKLLGYIYLEADKLDKALKVYIELSSFAEELNDQESYGFAIKQLQKIKEVTKTLKRKKKEDTIKDIKLYEVYLRKAKEFLKWDFNCLRGRALIKKAMKLRKGNIREIIDEIKKM